MGSVRLERARDRTDRATSFDVEQAKVSASEFSNGDFLLNKCYGTKIRPKDAPPIVAN